MRKFGWCLFSVAVAYASCDAPTCQFKVQGLDGQGCWDLAAACGLDMSVPAQNSKFYELNPNIKNDCSNLAPGQRVCCTPGGLAPIPNSDDSCCVYSVKSGDNCGLIGGMFGLTIDQIDALNNKDTTSFGGTWGFKGCTNLQPGNICISKGNKGPIPAKDPDPEVVCGPTASGNGTNVKCPLNTCCNEWGRCGLTSEFCDVFPGVNPGVKGCQDNCNIEYVKGEPPAQFINVGYYESWNQKWPCLNAGIAKQDLAPYTHIHYSFADIDMNLQVTLDTYAQAQFDDFKHITKKKIISFGGWGISTEAATHGHFPNAALPGNRAMSAASMVAFMQNNGLDGIDIDWEYPEKPDTPGIGTKGDAANYLELLKEIRRILPQGKSLSIAAPASFWYLKAFPIAEMSKYLDYIVYMTYDLHGQWDFGNKWTGEYLRSHVNWTETQSALAMITHAGVPSNKILLGLGAYGRSFKQVDPNCFGPDCKFTGPDSGATPGPCTGTPGYVSLAEIQRIRSTSRVRNEYNDADSTIMLYDKDQWIAFNTPEQLDKRQQLAISMNLGGTVMWALDLLGDGQIAENPCNVRELSYDELLVTQCTNTDLTNAMITWADDLTAALQVVDMGNAIRYFDWAGTEQRGWIDKINILKNTLNGTPSRLTKRAASLELRQLAGAYDILHIPSLFNTYIGSVASPITILSSATISAAVKMARDKSGVVNLNIGTISPKRTSMYFAAAAFTHLLERCDTWSNWFSNKDVKYAIDTCVDKVDLDREIINTPDIQADPADPDGTVVGPKLIPSLININNLYGDGTCPATTAIANTNAITHADISGSGKYRYAYKISDKDPEKRKCLIPIYYINRFDNSLGVACNSYRYMMTRRQILYSRESAGHKPGRGWAYMYDYCPRLRSPTGLRDQRDEFPMMNMYEGYAADASGSQDWDLSLACIPQNENGSEGSHFNNFLEMNRGWEKCDPMSNDPEEPLRDGPIAPNTGGVSPQRFIVQVMGITNYNNQCISHMDVVPPKSRAGVINGVLQYRYSNFGNAILIRNHF
ncbi:hypothetical protein GGI13_002204 [Coemansia sp. RSA 455]|nr:hypothetical protein GGI13_002204 [Coemansia sp. RSA 455]